MLRHFIFFTLAYNDRGYGHLAVTVSQDVSFAGAFTVALRQGESGSKAG